MVWWASMPVFDDCQSWGGIVRCQGTPPSARRCLQGRGTRLYLAYAGSMGSLSQGSLTISGARSGLMSDDATPRPVKPHQALTGIAHAARQVPPALRQERTAR